MTSIPMPNGLIDIAARRSDFEWLHDLRAIERRHLSVFRTLTERNIACEIGYHQALGSPLTVKQLYLLGLAPIVTMHRHLQRLCKAGIVVRVQSKRDARVRELRLAPAGEEVFASLFAAASSARGAASPAREAEAPASPLPAGRIAGGADRSIVRWEFIRDRMNDCWTWRAVRVDGSIDSTSESHPVFGRAVMDAVRHGFHAHSMHWVVSDREWSTHFQPGKPPLTVRDDVDASPQTTPRGNHAIAAARAEEKAAVTRHPG